MSEDREIPGLRWLLMALLAFLSITLSFELLGESSQARVDAARRLRRRLHAPLVSPCSTRGARATPHIANDGSCSGISSLLLTSQLPQLNLSEPQLTANDTHLHF
jgi:hypothetical protein